MNTYRGRRITRNIRRLLGLQPRYALICLSPSDPTTVYDGTIPGNVFVQEQYSNGVMGKEISVRGPAGNSVQLALGTWVELQPTSDNRLAIVNYNVPGNASAGINVLAANTPQLQSGNFVGQQSLITALVTPQATPDLTVAIKGWTAIVNTTYYEFTGNGSVDLSSYVPSSGNNLYAVVFIKSDYVTILIATSTARAIADLPLNSADIQQALTSGFGTDSGATPLAAIRLYGGQTKIIQSDIQQDLRQMINNTQNSGTGSVTNLSWVTHDGVSASIANPTTTPAITPSLGATTPDSSAAKGTGGAGFFADVAQSSDPSTPGATGWRLFADASGYLAWIVKNGSDTFKRTFTGVLTAARNYALPDKSGTVALTSDIPSVPLTTKGDLLGFDSADARVPVGADNLVLTADSSQSLGLKYALVSLVNSIAGILGLAHGGTNADLSAGGGAHNFLAQDASHVVSSRVIADADLPTALAGHTISGGTMDNTPIGGSTPAAAAVTTLNASGIETTQSGKVRHVRVVTAAGAITVTTADDIVVVNKGSGAATTVNLPSSPTTGQTFVIHDGKGDAATNNITITPASGNINGASTLVLNVAYAGASCTYNGTQWDADVFEASASGGITQLTGDVTAGPGSGSQAATLATVNSNVGTFSRVKSITANAKGLITAITQGLVDLTAEVTGILPVANGGTGLNSLTAHDLVVGNGASTPNFLAPGTKGNIPVSDGTDYGNLGAGTDGQGLVSQAAQTRGAYWRDILYPKNELINGGFNLNSRGAISPQSTKSYTNDQYSLDQWYVLTQTGAVNDTQSITAPGAGAGGGFSAEMTQAQASAQRMGRAQLIEGYVSHQYRSVPIRFQGQVRITNSQAVRYAILEWTGANDTPTSDVVRDWTSGTYTPGNFFLSTQLTVVATDHITPSANTWTPFSITGTPDTSMNNLYVFIWTEGTAALNVKLETAQCMLVSGIDPVPWVIPDPAAESIRAQRFLKVFYSANGTNTRILNGVSAGSTSGNFLYMPTTPFRIVPTLTATATDWQANATDLSALTVDSASTIDAIQLDATYTGGPANGVVIQFRGDGSADRYAILSAEL